MKPPVNISIDRLVMPAAFRGREAAFASALSEAVQGRPSGQATDPVGRAAHQAAAAIADKTGGDQADG